VTSAAESLDEADGEDDDEEDADDEKLAGK
jgi:hypothetical protein